MFRVSLFPSVHKRRAPEIDETLCNQFVQNSHVKPIGDKTDSQVNNTDLNVVGSSGSSQGRACHNRAARSDDTILYEYGTVESNVPVCRAKRGALMDVLEFRDERVPDQHWS